MGSRKTSASSRSPVPELPLAQRPSPFRRHARDIRAVALFVCGAVILISLYYGGPALALGTFLHALLGWGAPVLGTALVLAGVLTALGPVPLHGLETRAGALLLLAGFMLTVGLAHRGGHPADGGDLGNGMASGLIWALAKVVGDNAAYACAMTVAWAINLVGLVMVTDRPLVRWARLVQAAFRWIASRAPRRRSSERDLEEEPPPPSASQTRTKVERAGPGRGAIPAAALAAPPPASASASPFSERSPGELEGLPPLRPAEEDSNRTTVIRGGAPARRSARASFAGALDALLPTSQPAPHEREEPASPGAVPLEELIAGDAVPGRERQVTDSSNPSGLPDSPDLGSEDESEDFETRESQNGKRKKGDGSRKAAGVALSLVMTADELPPATLLKPMPPAPRKTLEESNATVHTLERTLQEFKVDGQVVEIAEGPTLTRYEIRLAPGILVKRILSLADNIAMALEAIDVRVEAPIPGKSAIGVEVPKRVRGMVGLRELVETADFKQGGPLTFALGRDVTGAPRFADLARMPHLLIAGSTGSGKSACLNTLITSLLFRATPDQVQFVMIDPKRVELSLYDGIPHLCHSIVRDSKYAPKALARAMAEMDRRYLLLQSARTRDIVGYNNKMDLPTERLPYIVVVIDELADLMMTSGAETEHAITRLAQLARAVGIHLVVATQRPSVDIVTGKIKANISSRIAFAVSSGVDSRTILDCIGAERLVGRGDMLFIPIDASKPQRIQGAFIGEPELEQVVEFWRAKGKPDYYLERQPLPTADLEPSGDAGDEMYGDAVRVVMNAGQASTSMLQRKLKIGYNRAATLIELMEEHGVVGPQDGVRPREVLVSREQWEMSQG